MLVIDAKLNCIYQELCFTVLTSK